MSFNAEMVRALLADAKSETRRVVRPQGAVLTRSAVAHVFGVALPAEVNPWVPCPYGQPGDILRVREAFRIRAWCRVESGMVLGEYLADRKTFEVRLQDAEWEKFARWKKPFTGKPPMYCFRSLSRLWLEVVSVRVERVQDIGKDGRAAKAVRAEGITDHAIEAWARWLHPDDAPALAFAALWDSINASCGHSWKSNPWVWVIVFRRIPQPC